MIESHLQSRTRVMIVDDHAMVRSGLSAFLSAADDFELVGEAENGTLSRAIRDLSDIL